MYLSGCIYINTSLIYRSSCSRGSRKLFVSSHSVVSNCGTLPNVSCSSLSSAVDISTESDSPISVEVGVTRVVIACIASSVCCDVNGRTLPSFECSCTLCASDIFSLFRKGISSRVIIV